MGCLDLAGQEDDEDANRVITPSPEGDGFFSEHACLSPTTLRSAGPIRASPTRRPGSRDASRRGLKPSLRVPSGWLPIRPSGADGISRVYRGTSPFSICVLFYHHRRAAIPPSPEGDGPLAAFLWMAAHFPGARTTTAGPDAIPRCRRGRLGLPRVREWRSLRHPHPQPRGLWVFRCGDPVPNP
jgi:hypothetical protein